MPWAKVLKASRAKMLHTYILCHQLFIIGRGVVGSMNIGLQEAEGLPSLHGVVLFVNTERRWDKRLAPYCTEGLHRTRNYFHFLWQMTTYRKVNDRYVMIKTGSESLAELFLLHSLSDFHQVTNTFMFGISCLINSLPFSKFSHLLFSI